jgi:tetratricopeptide (TPR) repeat protein
MASSRDWFRSTTWDASVAVEFERRLARCRPRNRAEYARIQAPYLARTGVPEFREVAEALLCRVIDNYPGEPATKSALEDLARLFADSGRYAEAEQLLRRLVDLIATSPTGTSSTSGNVELKVAEVIVAAGDDTRLPDAASWLDRHTARLAHEPFYDMHFRHHLARARIATRSSAVDDAAEHAEAALSWADRTVSPFANHPDLGFTKVSPEQRSELVAMITRTQ